MEKFMKKIQKYWGWILLISAIFGGFWKMYECFDYQNEEMLETQKIAQQALIWNKDIPTIQRAEVCDIYLQKGFDSYTKKLCENVILADEDIKVENKEVKNDEQQDLRYSKVYSTNSFTSFGNTLFRNSRYMETTIQ